MKKIIALVLAFVMVCSVFAGCSGNASGESGEQKDYSAMTIDELKSELTTISDGKLTMVTSPDFAPYEFYALDEEGNPTLAGFDIALGQYIADYLGLELEIVPMDFDGTISELGAGKADIGMAGYSPDPDRSVQLPYFQKVYASRLSSSMAAALKSKQYSARYFFRHQSRQGIRYGTT